MPVDTSASATAPSVPVPGEATVPLAAFVQPAHRHYFTRRPDRPNYRARRYTFAGVPALMPLVRAFLDTCAADQSTDYRYLFTLLGGELATNALRHSLSGQAGGGYTLLVHRHRTGLHLSCRDRGGLRDQDAHLKPQEKAVDPSAESGRGLALVDALATEWGDNGNAHYRTVWFHLAYDLSGSRWNVPTLN